jgi:hypothetical protein
MIEYNGKKSRFQIRASRIERITYGKQGIDWINSWVTVDWGGGRQALFADGGWLGWAGVLGRTRRIYRRIALVGLQSARNVEVRKLDQLNRTGRIIGFMTIVYFIVSVVRTLYRWFEGEARYRAR